MVTGEAKGKRIAWVAILRRNEGTCKRSLFLSSFRRFRESALCVVPFRQRVELESIRILTTRFVSSLASCVHL
jgi:hypothetical protein